MTAARQQKSRPRAGYVALVCAVLILGAASGSALRAGTTERIVTDRFTGLAIGGFDPVAFYTDGKPVLGGPDFEFAYGGAIWRFCNLGNREAFAAHPDVYMPQFGGYDPIGVARGIAVPGNPNLWRISGDRLFLFYDRGRMDTFIADAERVITAAERKWPEVVHTLSQ